MELTDDMIQKLSQELQPTIQEVSACLERSGLSKTKALSILLVLSAMYLSRVVDLDAHAACEHFKAEKLAGKLAGRSLMAAGPAVITACLTEWSLEIPPTLNVINTMAAFDAEVVKHRTD